MSTSFARFSGKGFWMHNAVAELWLKAMIEVAESKINTEAWLAEFKCDVEDALSANWIDGIMSSSFDKYLDKSSRLSFFIEMMADANEILIGLAESSDVVEIDGCSAHRDFLIPEIEKLMDLFVCKERISSPPEVFIKNVGWRVA